MFFRNLANEAFHPLSLWQDLSLTALRNSIFSLSALYFRCAEFFKDTIGLEEMAAVAGKNSYLSLFQNVLASVECQSSVLLVLYISLTFYTCILLGFPTIHCQAIAVLGFSYLILTILFTS